MFRTMVKKENQINTINKICQNRAINYFGKTAKSKDSVSGYSK